MREHSCRLTYKSKSSLLDQPVDLLAEMDKSS